ncbi:hypothetical protein [Nostoc sp.]
MEPTISSISNLNKAIAIAVVKPSSYLTTAIRVEKVKNIALLNHL